MRPVVAHMTEWVDRIDNEAGRYNYKTCRCLINCGNKTMRPFGIWANLRTHK